MIQRIITIATLYLKTTYSSRSTLVFAILMPLLFTFVLGQAMGAMGPGETPTSWTLRLVDEDRSPYSEALIEHLEADPIVDVLMQEREAALAAVDADEAIAALIVPAGFGESLSNGDSASLAFHQNMERIAQAQILQQAVAAASAEVNGSVAAASLSAQVAGDVGLFEAQIAAREAYFDAAFAAAETAWEAGAPVEVTAQQVTRLEDRAGSVPLGASQSSPGMLVMYALFFTFGGGASLLVERDEGTLRRLLVMPTTKGVIMTGKLLGIFLGALAQMAIMVLAGQFFFGVEWGQSPLALVTMLLAYGFAGTALGLLVAALAKTVAQANALGTIMVMALASLGGAWWPIEIVPGWMQQLALTLPTGWAMRGFHDIITRGLGLNAVLLETGVLLGFGLLFLVTGVWRFRYE